MEDRECKKKSTRHCSQWCAIKQKTNKHKVQAGQSGLDSHSSILLPLDMVCATHSKLKLGRITNFNKQLFLIIVMSCISGGVYGVKINDMTGPKDCFCVIMFKEYCTQFECWCMLHTKNVHTSQLTPQNFENETVLLKLTFPKITQLLLLTPVITSLAIEKG